MLEKTGDPKSPIWLIGDSEPARWASKLEGPLDPRHPARHSIWTSVADYMQDSLFRQEHVRLDSSRLFIRNAVRDSNTKPAGKDLQWPGLQSGLRTLAADLATFKPDVVLTFGAFAYEFGRRASGAEDLHPYSHWGSRRLGDAFREACVSEDSPIVAPLLHATIARGTFLSAHREFTGVEGGNYFEYVGTRLAALIMRRPRLSGLLL